MKKTILAVSFCIALLTMGCGEAGAGDGSAKAVAPIRYLAENYQNLSDERIAKYLDALSNKDKEYLGDFYTAFVEYLQYKGCNANSNLVTKQKPQLTDINFRLMTCNDNLQTIQQTAALFGYVTIEEYFQNSQAKSNASEILIIIKCSTGEIDKGSCSMYVGMKYQQMEDQSDFYKQLFEGESAQCTYDGQILSSGAMCVL